MKQLPLSKTLSPDDYKALAPELAVVDIFKDSPVMTAQHPARRWEYAMALRALGEWRKDAPPTLVVRRDALDVGGGGSPLKDILNSIGLSAEIIDPQYNYGIEKVLQKKPAIKTSFITCISVLEHVAIPTLPVFLQATAQTLLPGGLLFLTCDFTDQLGEGENPPADTFHYHWMRAQIFNRHTLTRIAEELYRVGNLVLFGGEDQEYHGAQVFDYSFASLCMVKDEKVR